MSLANTINHIKKFVGRRAPELPGLRARNPELMPYENIEALLAALDTASPLGHAERGRLVAALVRDHQSHGGQLAQMILVITFEKGLTRIRGRLGRPKSEDLDQKVMLAFFEVLKKRSIVNAAEYAPIAIARETKKAVFGPIKSDREKAIPTSAFDDETHVVGDLFETEDTVGEKRMEHAQRFLDLASEELRDMLVRTIAGNESLWDYVERAMPAADPEQRRIAYERLKNQRYEAMLSIRVLEGNIPS